MSITFDHLRKAVIAAAVLCSAFGFVLTSHAQAEAGSVHVPPSRGDCRAYDGC